MIAETSLIIDILFWIASTFLLSSALGVILSKNLFYSAMFLMSSFASVAFLLFLLNAEFVAVVQILVYLGGVAVLLSFIIFFIGISKQKRTIDKRKFSLAFVAVFALVAILSVISFTTEWITFETIENGSELNQFFADSTNYIGDSFIREFVIGLEAVAILIAASILSALAILKKTIES